MSISIDKVIATLSSEEQERIKAETAARVKSYRVLLEFRRQLGLTQSEVANRMHVTQESISRLERRKDMHISTLKRYVEALGGQLEIHVSFPDNESKQAVAGTVELA